MPNARSLAFVGCRLLSLYILYRAIQNLGLVASSLYLYPALKADSAPSFLEPAIATLLIDIVVFLGLWFGAGRIADKVAGPAAEAEDREGFSRRELLATAVAAAGILVLVTAIPGLVGHIVVFVLWKQHNIAELVQLIALVVMGLLCLAGPRDIADLVMKARRWGPD